MTQRLRWARASALDVLSLLRALPPAALTSELIALVALLEHPRGSSHWPRACLDDKCTDEWSLVGNTMSMLSSVSIKGFSDREWWTAFRAHVAKWPTKVHALQVSQALTAGVTIDEVWYDLRLCSSLHEVWLHRTARMLEAVSTREHRVDTLTLSFISSLPTNTLAKWLAMDHNKSLNLRHCSSTSDDALARALATSSRLSSLTLMGCTDLQQRLVDQRLDLRHLSALSIQQSHNLDPLWVLSSLDLSKMTKLDLDAHGTGCIVGALPVMPVLDELILNHAALSDTLAMRSETQSLPAVRRVRSNLGTATDPCFDAMLGMILRSTRLESIEWHGMLELSHARCARAVDALKRCLQRGVRSVSFLQCGIDNSGAAALAAVLHDTHPLPAMTVSLHNNAVGITALLRALATSTNVTVRVTGDWTKEMRRDAKLNAMVMAARVVIAEDKSGSCLAAPRHY